MEAMRKGATSGVCLGLVALFGSEQLVRGMPGSYRRPTSTTSRPQALNTILQLQRNTNRAKNVILFVGDGMRVLGGPHLSARIGAVQAHAGTTRKVVDPGCTGSTCGPTTPGGRTKGVRDCSRQRGRPPVHPLGERANHPTRGRVLTFDQPWGSTTPEPPRDCCVVKQ